MKEGIHLLDRQVDIEIDFQGDFLANMPEVHCPNYYQDIDVTYYWDEIPMDI